ncbi:hypothetical protein [Arthrobacter sp. NEB 688]|nr:hypothetical protein [Arthrobacter sp. NEB 688]QKE82895.1 hypothetical protein HL663_02295 [Arthrobacter sp. NEB 688]
MTLLSLSDTELAHLICDGAVVEVPIGALTRYALADGIPTDVRTRGAGL